MGNRRWNGVLLLILCGILLSACSKQPKCFGQTRSDAAAAAETTDALAVAPTVVSGRYSTGFFTSDKLSVVSAAAADDGAVYLWGRNFQNEVESNWLIRYNADGTSEEYRLSLSKDGYITSLDVSAGEVYYLERVDAEDESAAWFLHTLQTQETLDWADAGNDLENLIVSGACLSDGRENALYLQPAGGKGSAGCEYGNGNNDAFLQDGRNRRRLLRRYRQPLRVGSRRRGPYENRNASAFVSQRQAPARHEFRLRLSGARASGAVRVEHRTSCRHAAAFL